MTNCHKFGKKLFFYQQNYSKMVKKILKLVKYQNILKLSSKNEIELTKKYTKFPINIWKSNKKLFFIKLSQVQK